MTILASPANQQWQGLITSKATPTVCAVQDGGQAFAWICFCGTGTVGKVAAQLRRDYVMSDLKKEYVEDFAIPKVKAVETGVPVAEQKQGQGSLLEYIQMPISVSNEIGEEKEATA